MAKKNLEQAFADRGLSVLSGHWITMHRQPIAEVLLRGRKTATFGLTSDMYDLGDYQLRWKDGEKYDPYAKLDMHSMTATLSVNETVVAEITIFFRPKEYYGEFLSRLVNAITIESEEKAA